MICPKCGSDNVLSHVVTDVKTKHRGCIGWCFWIILTICTFGLLIIIPLLTNSKTVSKQKTFAVCQVCGHTWEIIERKAIKINKQVIYIVLCILASLIVLGLVNSFIHYLAQIF